jgi:hypothetical protein
MGRCALLIVLVLTTLATEQAEGFGDGPRRDSITVKSTSVEDKVVLIDIDVAGKAVQLECTLNVPHCGVLKPGPYVMLRLPENKGPYNDCPNVEVYQKAPTGDAEDIVGQYCLLQE